MKECPLRTTPDPVNAELQDYQPLDLEALCGKLTFGNILESHRQAEDLTQAAFARQLGLPRQRLCDFEKGRRLPALSHAYEFAKIMGIHPAVLVQIVLQEWLEQAHIPLKVSLVA